MVADEFHLGRRTAIGGADWLHRLLRVARGDRRRTRPVGDPTVRVAEAADPARRGVARRLLLGVVLQCLLWAAVRSLLLRLGDSGARDLRGHQVPVPDL